MKKILLTMAVALSGLTASAQWVKPTVDRTCDVVAGDTLYLYNTGAKMFLNQGNSYGTQASLADEGLMVRVNQYVAGEDAAWDGKTYTIEDFRPVQNSWFYVFIASDIALFLTLTLCCYQKHWVAVGLGVSIHPHMICSICPCLGPLPQGLSWMSVLVTNENTHNR